MKLFSLILSLILSTQALALDPCECPSQLLRVDLDNNRIRGELASSQIQGRFQEALRNLFNSNDFVSAFQTSYPMEPMGFPFNRERCERERNTIANFRGVDCSDPFFCSSSSVSEEIKARYCLQFDCPMILGAARMSQCPDGNKARPTRLAFPQPINVRRLGMNLTTLQTSRNPLRACFNLTALDLTVGVSVEFAQTREVQYRPMGLSDVGLSLDGPREVCMSANLDLSSANPISNIQIETPPGRPFVSDAMIDASARTARVTGVDGYSPETVSALRASALPALARHFRPTIEDAVKLSLASVFEEQLKTTLGSQTFSAGAMVSELGMGNLAVKKYADLLDCALLKQARTRIPSNHACLTQAFPFRNGQMRERDIPNPQRAVQYLQEQMARNENVTSESLRLKLLGFEERMNQQRLGNLYTSAIRPLAQQIESAQAQSPLFEGINFVRQLNAAGNTSLNVALPEICDDTATPSFAGRSIPGCAVQTYVDLDAMNNLMKAMYDSGRLCHRGRGDFVPALDAQGRQIYDRDFARGQGCFVQLEEKENGFRCYLNGPPEIRYDSASRGFRMQLRTRQCYRGAVFAGQGKVGGDINFDIAFTPGICEGSFCLQDARPEWSVVDGTARFSLQESSFFNGIVRRTIDSTLGDMINGALRVPLVSSGLMSQLPVIPDGRIDMGPGYFGACWGFPDASGRLSGSPARASGQ